MRNLRGFEVEPWLRSAGQQVWTRIRRGLLTREEELHEALQHEVEQLRGMRTNVQRATQLAKVLDAVYALADAHELSEAQVSALREARPAPRPTPAVELARKLERSALQAIDQVLRAEPTPPPQAAKERAELTLRAEAHGLDGLIGWLAPLAILARATIQARTGAASAEPITAARADRTLVNASRAPRDAAASHRGATVGRTAYAARFASAALEWESRRAEKSASATVNRTAREPRSASSARESESRRAAKSASATADRTACDAHAREPESRRSEKFSSATADRTAREAGSAIPARESESRRAEKTSSATADRTAPDSRFASAAREPESRRGDKSSSATAERTARDSRFASAAREPESRRANKSSSATADRPPREARDASPTRSAAPPKRHASDSRSPAAMSGSSALDFAAREGARVVVEARRSAAQAGSALLSLTAARATARPGPGVTNGGADVRLERAGIDAARASLAWSPSELSLRLRITHQSARDALDWLSERSRAEIALWLLAKGTQLVVRKWVVPQLTSGDGNSQRLVRAALATGHTGSYALGKLSRAGHRIQRIRRAVSPRRILAW